MARTFLTLYIPAKLLYETTSLISRWADGVRGSDSVLGVPGGVLRPALDITDLGGLLMIPVFPVNTVALGNTVMVLEVCGPEWALQDLLGTLSTGSDELCAGVAVANAELAPVQR